MTLEERIPIKVLFDRKDAAEWQRLNPVIDDGELVVELDTHRLKVGDGKLNYNDLPYYEGPQGESITKVQLSENGDLSVWIGEKETKLGNIKGQKGDKGTSITDITKEGETLTITLSDDTQKTFSIPNGQKGDRGKSVESARVDESGNFYVTIEGQSEKLLGNIKGGKGDKGDPLKFEDLTPDQIAQIKAKDVDLSVYATKAELAEIDVSKQLTDYLSKADADSKYATKGDLETISLPSDVLTQSIASNLYVLKEDAQSYVTWQILEQSVRAKANAIHSHRMDDVIGLNQALSDRPTTERMAQAMETIMRDVVKQSDLRNVVYQGQLAGYATKAELQQIETTPGPQGPPGQQGNPGRPGRDAVLNVEVVSSAPSYQQPNVIYLVKG